MKMKIVKMVVATVVVAAVGYGLFLNQSKDSGMSEIELANVEAVAAGETGKVECANMFDPCAPGLLGPYLTYIDF